MSYNNDEPEELETLQNKEDSTNTYEAESVNMEFLERVTLPDGTQAYLTRDNNQEGLLLFTFCISFLSEYFKWYSIVKSHLVQIEATATDKQTKSKLLHFFKYFLNIVIVISIINISDDTLFNSFQINGDSEMLLSDLTEEQNIQLQPLFQPENMKELPDEEEEDIENNLVFTSTADEEDNGIF